MDPPHESPQEMNFDVEMNMVHSLPFRATKVTQYKCWFGFFPPICSSFCFCHDKSSHYHDIELGTDLCAVKSIIIVIYKL